MDRSAQSGTILLLATLVAFAAVAALVFVRAGATALVAQRDRVTERSLAEAREALLAWAADRPVTAAVGPGYLPCPDLDDDGWAEAICGSLSGDRGQEQRLGRLPWKTLGLPDLRDGHGERLWYAVSTRHKGLLNCAASAACVDMSPASAFGTITVRDPSGRIVLDGRLADAERGGAAAVVIAPGPPLVRLRSGTREAFEQRRRCEPPDCDPSGRCVAQPAWLAPRCDPANYLDVAPTEHSGEDNARFHDRTDAERTRNGDGFVQGPIRDGEGRVVVNDRVAAVHRDDLLPRVMRRVALELAHCLGQYASRPENAGRLPPPERACDASPRDAPFGRVPDTPFAVSGGMLPRWWRVEAGGGKPLSELPTRARACTIAVPPDDDGAERSVPPPSPASEAASAGGDAPAWWRSWKPYVFYAPAHALRSATLAADCARPQDCLELVDADGRAIGGPRRFALVVSRRAGECATPRLACDASRCFRVSASPAARAEVSLAVP